VTLHDIVLNCTATSRQDVVVRHDAEDVSSSEQKPRRQWDDQDVSQLIHALDHAELSSSCSTSRTTTSCSGSVSQTSCVTDDVDDAATAAAATLHPSDQQHTLTGRPLQSSQSTRLTRSRILLSVYFRNVLLSVLLDFL